MWCRGSVGRNELNPLHNPPYQNSCRLDRFQTPRASREEDSGENTDKRSKTKRCHGCCRGRSAAVQTLARELSISAETLARWRAEAPSQPVGERGWSAGACFEAVILLCRDARGEQRGLVLRTRGVSPDARAMARNRPAGAHRTRGRRIAARESRHQARPNSPALTRLAVSGKIRRTEWKTAARKWREVWAPVEAASPPDDAGAPVALVSP